MGKGTCYAFVTKYLQESVHPGDVVVETGCGAALYRPIIESLQAAYYGCDLANDQYENIRDVNFFCSANSLPLSDASTALIFNQAAFDYIPEPKRTIAEAYRVLKPGGKFTIFTYKEKTLKTIDENCRKRGRHWELSHHVFSKNDLQKWLNSAGFTCKDIGGKIDFLGSAGWKRNVLDTLHCYSPVQSMYTHWLVIEAIKPL